MNTNTSNTTDGGQPIRTTTRRRFLGTTALAASALTLAPRHLLGGTRQISANDKLNIAGIGVGGMGANNLRQCADENIVALCDVDQDYAAKTFSTYPKAKIYVDFREMLEKQKDIDAVIIATPDHTHAMIGMAAMRAGKHVYIQKPLAHSIYEARLLTETARQNNIVTQMGNQGHSGDGTRLLYEWLQAGIIGDVRDVHAWTNRPVWPQGVEVDRPQETPAVPSTLNWDRWVGPAAFRPYHPTYVPGTWRAWWEFGTGSLGDLGCHILDAPFWGLKVKYPVSAEGCISTYWKGLWKYDEPKLENYPRSTIVRFKFPARENLPACNLTWWDGGMMPPRPDSLDPEETLGDSDGGVIFLGEKGILICDCYGMRPRLFPKSLMQEARKIPHSLDRIPGGSDGHEKDWVRACKGGKPANSNFDYSGPLAEMVLMGNLAVRYPNRKLLWDAEKMEVTNDKDASSYVRRHYRDGWTL
jgi:predicted dehydrogenase